MGISKKHKLTSIVAIIVILILIPIIVVGTKYISNTKQPLSTTDKEIIFTVNNGDSLYGVVNKLNNEGILKNLFLTKVYLKLNNQSGNIIPGDYKVDSKITLGELVKKLEKGDIISNKVTIPEGYGIEDIADKLDENGVISKEEFLRAVKNYDLPPYVKNNPKKRYNLEGYLFPDTYSFSPNVDGKAIIDTMIKRFELAIKEVEEKTGLNIAESDYEKYVNIASMIEKEARVDEDRPLVSSVIYNRLKVNMPLQLDATVLYSLGEHRQIVTLNDLKVDSPYNTYKYKGLPVGPISNPGLASLIASVNPAQTDYIYYLLAKDDKHYFTNDYKDFLKKKEELGY